MVSKPPFSWCLFQAVVPLPKSFLFPFERSFWCFFLFQQHTKRLLRLFLYITEIVGVMLLKTKNIVKKRSLPTPPRFATRLHTSEILSTREIQAPHYLHELHAPVPQSCSTLDPCPLVYCVCYVPRHTGSLPVGAP
jgi:hypothetical protein